MCLCLMQDWVYLLGGFGGIFLVEFLLLIGMKGQMQLVENVMMCEDGKVCVISVGMCVFMVQVSDRFFLVLNLWLVMNMMFGVLGSVVIVVLFIRL